MLLQTTLASVTPGFGESSSLDVVEIVLVGFSFVFCILLLLSLTTWVFGKVFAHISVEEPSSPIVAGAATLSASSGHSFPDRTAALEPEMNDPHYVAVIAAAIHCVMNGRKHRIVSIRPSDSSWAAEGRRQIFSSRRVR